jgi:hypothetical protein
VMPRREVLTTVRRSGCSTPAAPSFSPLKISHNVPRGTVATFWGWWDKLSGGKGSVNNVTSARLTDLGGGGTFYDCRVEATTAESRSNSGAGRRRLAV